MKMICSKCGSNKIRVSTKIDITIDMEDFERLIKKSFRKKTTQLVSADWDKSNFFCTECCYSWGYYYSPEFRGET